MADAANTGLGEWDEYSERPYEEMSPTRLRAEVITVQKFCGWAEDDGPCQPQANVI